MRAILRALRTLVEVVMARTRRLSLSVRRVVPGSPGTPDITPPAPPVLPPVFTSITPNTITQNTSGSYAIVGDRLTAEQILINLPAGVSAGALAITDAQHATVTLIASATATTGVAAITIHDATSGDSGAVNLTVNVGAPSGTATSTLNLRTGAPTANPAASKSAAFPLAKTNGAIATWQQLDTGNGVAAANDFVQATQGTPQSIAYRGFVSPPLSAQVILAGMTITFRYGLYAESAAAWQAAPVIYIWRPTTDEIVGVIRDSSAGIGSVTGSSGATSGKVVTIVNPATLTLQDGDRFALEWWNVGGGNDYVHHNYNGSTQITEGANAQTDGRASVDFSSPIYLMPNPLGTLRVGPMGQSSSTGSPSVPAITVASDAEYRSKLLPAGAGAGTLWDSSQATLVGQGPATGSLIGAASILGPDLAVVDTVNKFTDRDAIARNTLHVTIKPNGGAPLDPAKDHNGASANTPQGSVTLPSPRAWTQWYHRQLVRFKPGFRIDGPTCYSTLNPGFNSGGTDAVTGINYPTPQSGGYKLGPHPSNDVTRADFEITGGQNPGSEYLTGMFGVTCTTDQNYIVGAMNTIMPGWNTNGDVWEIIRVMRITGPTTARHAVYVGKVTDATLVKVLDTTRTLDTAVSTTWPAMHTISYLGKNHNRQLGAADTFPELWVSDVEFADITEAGFTWPAQIAVADRI